MDLEHKFARFGDGLSVSEDAVIEGLCQPVRAGRSGQRCGAERAYRGSLEGLENGGSAGQDAVAARPGAAHRCLGRGA